MILTKNTNYFTISENVLYLDKNVTSPVLWSDFATPNSIF